MSSTERLRRAEEILFQVSALPITERAAALALQCGSDERLAIEVESLLEHSERVGSFLEKPALGTGFKLLPVDEAHDEMVGRTVGRYRIERRIASGGMGTVYLARRADDQFVQRVALKIVKRGMATDEILQRFRRERQTLAGLEHPNIARLIDGGATEGGQPYLVMEFVEGEPIDVYCDRLSLDVDKRLELFLTVCDAVRYAHQNLVVHRDLKPGNVLVTKDGTPKLLDFGIAAVVDAAHARKVTAARERRLTLEYASPELIAGAAVATTSDVYSLGVILCELLTGELPYPFTTCTTDEVQRVLATTEPAAPSELVRRADPANAPLVRRLRGDLDTIVQAALRTEPDRRYPSVDRLAADVRRHLDRLPVSARRDTFSYRASRFVRRHALATTFASLSLAMLVAGGAAFAWQARVAGHQRDQAVRARSEAEAITGFLQHMLESADPARAGPGVTVHQVLDDAAGRLDGELGAQPLVQAGLRRTIGNTYLALGLYGDAVAQLRKAYRQRLEELGPLHADVAESMCELAAALYALDELDEAADLLVRAVEIDRSTGRPDSPERARALASLGAVRRAQGELDESERLQREALGIRRRVHGEDSLESAESMNNLAGVLCARDRLDEARPLLEGALRIRRDRLGKDHPLVAQSTDNLAVLTHRQGDLAGAEPLYREALEIEIRVLGPDHPDVAVTRRSLAVLLLARGELPEAEDQLRRSLAIRENSLPAADPRNVTTKLDLAGVLIAENQAEEATALIEAALEATRDLDSGSPVRTTAVSRAAALFERSGQSERAASLRAPSSPR